MGVFVPGAVELGAAIRGMSGSQSHDLVSGMHVENRPVLVRFYVAQAVAVVGVLGLALAATFR